MKSHNRKASEIMKSGPEDRTNRQEKKLIILCAVVALLMLLAIIRKLVS